MDPEVTAPPVKKARKAKAAKPPAAPKPPRAPVVRVVTAYLAGLSPAHATAADILGADFKRDLREELGLDAKVTALVSRRDSLEHDLEQVAEALKACVPSHACRDKLDSFAKSVAHHKGLVAHADEPTEDDRRGVQIN